MGRHLAENATDASLLGRTRRWMVDFEDVHAAQLGRESVSAAVEAGAEENHLRRTGDELATEHLVDVLRPRLMVKEHPSRPPFEFLDEAVANSREEEEAKEAPDESDRHRVRATELRVLVHRPVRVRARGGRGGER
jgi:hypothetical protein